MTTNKEDFFNNLSEQFSEPIYLTANTNEVNEEISQNHWAFSVPTEIASQMTTTDFLDFIEEIEDNYKHQLNNSDIDVDLIFYMWFDEMAGQLRINFINSNHKSLPFGCKLEFTEQPAEIVQKFLESNYLDGIPWEELETVDKLEQEEEIDNIEKNETNGFVLTVYRELIRKLN